jgi:hypothetical protein
MAKVRGSGYIIILLLVILVILIAAWWWYGVYTARHTTTTETVNFQPLLNDFNSYPYELWFIDNKYILDEALLKNPFRYRILLSNGEIFYDNRPNKPSPKLYPTIEYVLAASLGMGEILRDNYLNLAVRVTFGSIQRIVHISTPNYVS